MAKRRASTDTTATGTRPSLDWQANLDRARNALVVAAYDAIKTGDRDEARLLIESARIAKALAIATAERRESVLKAMAEIAGRELRRKDIESNAIQWTDGDVIRKSIDAKGALVRLVSKWLAHNVSDETLAEKFVSMLRFNASDFATLLLEMPPRPADLAPSIEAVRAIVKRERALDSRDLATVITRRSLVALGYPKNLAKDLDSGLVKRSTKR